MFKAEIKERTRVTGTGAYSREIRDARDDLEAAFEVECEACAGSEPQAVLDVGALWTADNVCRGPGRFEHAVHAGMGEPDETACGVVAVGGGVVGGGVAGARNYGSAQVVMADEMPVDDVAGGHDGLEANATITGAVFHRSGGHDECGAGGDGKAGFAITDELIAVVE